MRYLSLAEALAIAEAVTGTDIKTLARSARLDLLDSALHAPQAGFGDDDFYPAFLDKAAVLVVRIAKNHPLLDGNKRTHCLGRVERHIGSASAESRVNEGPGRALNGPRS